MEVSYGAPVAGSEKEVLGGFLDHYRATIAGLCEGLSEEQLRSALVPSGLTLLGMVKHLAYVEIGWFEEVIARLAVEYPWDEDDVDADFRIESSETPEAILDLYRDACDRSRAVMAKVSLDDIVRNPEASHRYNVRWVLVHMIEETARHAGQADILREQLGGSTEVGYI